VTTAEHAFAMLVALARMIPQATASMKAGRWEKNRFLGAQLQGATLGVIGYGNIGRVVVARGVAFGMRVLVYDPFVSGETVAQAGAALVDLPQLLSGADFVTVHVPLSRETRGLLGREQLALLKPTARLIQCARGGIVDEAALTEALREKRILGAALDVFEQEPPPPDHPLLAFENVICTPHLGASTVEAQEIVALQVAEDVVRYFASGTALNPVNAPRVPAEQRAALAPFLHVAERLGTLLAQTSTGGVDHLKLTYMGTLFPRDTTLLKAAVLKGLLSGWDRPVNEVNAELLAEERGLRVTEVRNDPAERVFRNLLCVEVGRGDQVRSAEGTVFPDGEERIVSIDGALLEVPVHGHLLVMRNHDRPGVVGAVGTVLGQRQVNIARLQVGLEPKSGVARSFWSVDRPVDAATLEQLRALPNVLEVHQVTL
jgi:D-3-phosphoglycerate dehydrogenase